MSIFSGRQAKMKEKVRLRCERKGGSSRWPDCRKVRAHGGRASRSGPATSSGDLGGESPARVRPAGRFTSFASLRFSSLCRVGSGVASMAKHGGKEIQRSASGRQRPDRKCLGKARGGPPGRSQRPVQARLELRDASVRLGARGRRNPHRNRKNSGVDKAFIHEVATEAGRRLAAV